MWEFRKRVLIFKVKRDTYVVLALPPSAQSLRLDLGKLDANDLPKSGLADGDEAVLAAKLLVQLVDGRAGDGDVRAKLKVCLQPFEGTVRLLAVV